LPDLFHGSEHVTPIVREGVLHDDAYVLEIIHDNVRGISDFNNGRSPARWITYDLLFNRVKGRAESDGLIETDYIRRGGVFSYQRPLMDIKADEVRLESLLTSNLDRLRQQGNISYSRRPHGLDYENKVEWHIPNIVTNRDRQIFLSVAHSFAKRSSNHRREPIATTDDYEDYFNATTDYSRRQFTEDNARDWLIGINSLIANDDLKLDCFGIHITVQGREHLRGSY